MTNLPASPLTLGRSAEVGGQEAKGRLVNRPDSRQGENLVEISVENRRRFSSKIRCRIFDFFGHFWPSLGLLDTTNDQELAIFKKWPIFDHFWHFRPFGC